MKSDNGHKIRWGMVIDLDKCTACSACVFACASENNCPSSFPHETAKGVTMGWREMITYPIEGSFPHAKQTILPRPCMHCANPPCVKVCPTGATYTREDGIVMQRSDICIGCRYCMVDCPYGVRVFNWYNARKRWAEAFDKSINPSALPPRPKGTVEKCLFNHHRLERLKNDLKEGKAPKYIVERLSDYGYKPGVEPSNKIWSKAVDIVMRYFFNREATIENFDPRMTGYLPACIQVCPPMAGVFGDLNDPDSLVSEHARSPRAFRLLEELGTDPSVIYLKEV